MEQSVLVLLLLNFLVISLLPKIFFRKDGKFTLMWFVTATPYLLAPISFTYQFVYPQSAIALALVGNVYTLFSVVGVIMSAAAIGMIFMTVGTHRIPVALWHQNQKDDKPAYIVTWGAYKYIRHPFYTSFILTFVATILLTLNWVVLFLCIYTVLILNYTASKEEKRLSSESGEIGAVYRSYMEKTGRFFPRLAYVFSKDADTSTSDVAH